MIFALRIAARVAAGLAAAACASSGAFAADEFVLDASHTFVQFSVDRFGYNAVLGEIPGVSGTVILDEKHPERSSVKATLDLSTLVSFDATRDEHLKGPFWFNVEKFPAISFASTGVKLTGENEADVVGALSLHGTEAPVTLHVKLNKRSPDPATKKDAVGFSATATLKRSDFGMTTALGMVGDEVSIRIETMGISRSDASARNGAGCGERKSRALYGLQLLNPGPRAHAHHRHPPARAAQADLDARKVDQ